MTAPTIPNWKGTVALPTLASRPFYEITVTANVTANSRTVTNAATATVPTGCDRSEPHNNTGNGYGQRGAAAGADTGHECREHGRWRSRACRLDTDGCRWHHDGVRRISAPAVTSVLFRAGTYTLAETGGPANASA